MLVQIHFSQDWLRTTNLQYHCTSVFTRDMTSADQ
uniref:Uncharacterized protein n=1 Tax=Arundo donax TaxID=35708 RepID=A0A0A8YXV4_ARUDO